MPIHARASSPRSSVSSAARLTTSTGDTNAAGSIHAWRGVGSSDGAVAMSFGAAASPGPLLPAPEPMTAATQTQAPRSTSDLPSPLLNPRPTPSPADAAPALPRNSLPPRPTAPAVRVDAPKRGVSGQRPASQRTPTPRSVCSTEHVAYITCHRSNAGRMSQQRRCFAEVSVFCGTADNKGGVRVAQAAP